MTSLGLPSSRPKQGIAELVGWEAADWTLESLARHYPDMLVMVGTESDLERERDVLQMTMADFERCTHSSCWIETNVESPVCSY